MKKIMVIATLAAALVGGSPAAQAHRPDGPSKGHGDRCSKVRKVAFVVGGTFVSGDDVSVTLLVKRANRHARDSGLVTIGSPFTATPTNPARIRYVNRSGPSDAQPTDKVRAIGKVTKLRRGCSSDGFTPTVTIRKVVVIGPVPDDSTV